MSYYLFGIFCALLIEIGSSEFYAEISRPCLAQLGIQEEDWQMKRVNQSQMTCFDECVLHKIGSIDEQGFLVGERIAEYFMIDDTELDISDPSVIAGKFFRKLISKCVNEANNEENVDCKRSGALDKCLMEWFTDE